MRRQGDLALSLEAREASKNFEEDRVHPSYGEVNGVYYHFLCFVLCLLLESITELNNASRSHTGI